MVSETDPCKVRRARRTMRWPEGRNVAVIFSVAYEAWTDGAASGVGPMGNPLAGGVFDPNADSYGRYGANAGIQRLVRGLERAGVSANVFTSGVLAERDPDQVRRVAEAGHEIVAHGYAQNLIPVTLKPEEDEESIRKTTELLTDVTGKRPQGWISPRATAGEDTMRRLIKYGYSWQGDVLDDDLPYLQVFPEGELTAIPLTIELNDLSHSMRFGRTAGQFIEVFDETLEAVLARPDDTVILDVLVHTHCYGRPAGAWAYEEIARKCAAREDIWLTTRGQIHEYFRGEATNMLEAAE